METIKVHIMVGDGSYGQALGEALKRSYSGFMIYTEEGQASEDADLVIYDDLRRRSTRCIYLADKPSQIDEERFIFYKYDSGKVLSDSILSAYSIMTGRKIIFSPKHKTFILAVHSATGGSGCTAIALAFAQELQRFQGQRTLYLSFEEFVSTGDYFSFKKSKGMKEYLYYILSGEDEKCSFPEEFLISNEYGMETFRPFPGKNPITEIKEEDFRLFFSKVYSLGRYDAIVLDCGNHIFESSICGMKIADKLLFLSGGEERDRGYLDYINRMVGSEIEEKRICAVNRYEDVTENLQEDEEGDLLEVSPPEYSFALDTNSFNTLSGKRTISLDTDFGMDVKNMLEILRR